MTKQHVHRKIKRSEADQARIKALRDSFQKERPSLETLVQSDEYLEPMPLGDFLGAKAIAYALKEMRQQVKMSLAEVSAKTGMDRATISRLENGVYPNTTINTINRLARAYGKRVTFRMEDEPEISR
jgi:DNA-binding Xre family transcriptional regulator